MKQNVDYLTEKLERRGLDAEQIKNRAMSLKIETPSWGYGNSGTRFKVFAQPGVPRNPFEKIEDAATVHSLTGIAPSVAIHIPWDRVEDFGELRDFATQKGLKIGAVNPNLFQDDAYKFGSLTHNNPAIRQKALDHLLECIEIAKWVDSTILSLWFADGTNYPGQGSFRQRKHWLLENLQKAYRELPDAVRMLIEYKFFEPAFYHTDIADWGIAYVLATKLGPKAQVLVDTGHHPQGTNIEWIVAQLIDENKLGGFHFNNRKYADDDLTVGSIHPYETFLIFNEIVEAEEEQGRELPIAYMLDQSHNLKPKIEAMIQSVLHAQELYTKALLVNRVDLFEARRSNHVVDAEQVLLDAFYTDVRPLLAEARKERGLPENPLDAYRKSGYPEKIVRERGSGKGQGWA